MGGLLLGVCALIAAVVLLVSSDAPAPKDREKTAKPNISASDGAIRDELLRGSDDSMQNDTPVIDAEDARRCKLGEADRPGAYAEMPNAVLYYHDLQGGVSSRGDAIANEAAGCFYANGRRSFFGFGDPEVGAGFGLTTGAGDFVAFSAVEDIGDGESSDSFGMWNLRNGQELVNDTACVGNVFECAVMDIALSPSGSSAFVACHAETCRIVKRNGVDGRRATVARLPYKGQPQITVHGHQLYWIDEHGSLKSTNFA
jgi:hypothetical protein